MDSTQRPAVSAAGHGEPAGRADRPTERLAHWAATTSRDWPTTLRRESRRAFLDIVACMIAGVREPPVRAVRGAVAGWSTGRSTIVGDQEGAAAAVAALVNGTMAHALDFDDNFDPAEAHATAVLAPALLALAEDRGSSGADVVDAYLVGLQVMARVGQALNPPHRTRGWHATATVGVLGAAAGCGRLMRLDTLRMRHAISIATSLAGGSMVQFGTMLKPAHAGIAAMSGVLAASFAEAGLTAAAEVIVGRYGLQRLMIGPDVEVLRHQGTGREHLGFALAMPAGDLGTPHALEQFGLALKLYPNCGSAHAPLEAFLALRSAHALRPEQVAEVRVFAPESQLNNLPFSEPRDAFEARFSLHYAIAVAAHTGSVALDDFTPEALERAEVRDLARRVRLCPVPDPSAGRAPLPSRVEVDVASAGTLAFEVGGDEVRGGLRRPLTDADLCAKLRACGASRLPEDKLRQLEVDLASFGDARPAADLMDLLRTVAGIPVEAVPAARNGSGSRGRP